MILRTGTQERRIRLSVYKVTGSGRSKPDERRIEITTTYQSGLPRLSSFEDVVLGYDEDREIYVGVDSRRLDYGGHTANASSFFDVTGLDWKRTDQVLILPREVRLFASGEEYHAFVKPARLAEYLFNAQVMHSGSYAGGGPFSGPTRAGPPSNSQAKETDKDVLVLEYTRAVTSRPPPPQDDVTAMETGDFDRLRRAKLTPEEFLRLQQIREANGVIGEQHVLNLERRRLRKLGRADLAARVEWTSQTNVSAGYDIASFDADGSPRLIEVKATSGSSNVFEMTLNEWGTAVRQRTRYYVYRVTDVRSVPKVREVRDPVSLEASGQITRSASGWKVQLL